MGMDRSDCMPDVHRQLFTVVRVIYTQDSLSSLALELADPSGTGATYQTAMAAIPSASRPGCIHKKLIVTRYIDPSVTEAVPTSNYAVEMVAQGFIHHLKLGLSKLADVNASNLLILDIYNGGVYNMFHESQLARAIQVCSYSYTCP